MTRPIRDRQIFRAAHKPRAFSPYNRGLLKCLIYEALSNVPDSAPSCLTNFSFWLCHISAYLPPDFNSSSCVPVIYREFSSLPSFPFTKSMTTANLQNFYIPLPASLNPDFLFLLKMGDLDMGSPIHTLKTSLGWAVQQMGISFTLSKIILNSVFGVPSMISASVPSKRNPNLS